MFGSYLGSIEGKMHLLYKTNRIHAAWFFFMIIDHRWRHKCDKNISDTLSCASRASFLFLPHFDAICDFLLNKRWATCKLFFKLTSKEYQNFLCTLLDILDSFWRKQLFCAFCIKHCHDYWVSIPYGFFCKYSEKCLLSVHGLCDRNQSRITFAADPA